MFVLSSPLLTNNEKVPEAVLGDTISYLKLSGTPLANEPLTSTLPELFWLAP